MIQATRILCISALLLLQCGCVSLRVSETKASHAVSEYPDWPASSMTATVRSPESSYAVMKVFFATDRRVASSDGNVVVFGSKRSSKMYYGTCEISIPRDHRMGQLESPSIWRFEISESPAKHVMLLNTRIQAQDQFFSDLKARVGKSKGKSSFLFVHGYNVGFVDAARRTAQMAYDLGFDGAPVFYSWPSRGETKAYIADEQMIEWTQPNLRLFLEEYVSSSNADNIYIIAHSMGNRALTRAISSLLLERPDLKSRIREIILAAPDIDSEVFRRDIAPAMSRSGNSITLYASSEDKALILSKSLHDYPRAGDAGEGLVVVPGIETIDASRVDTGFLGHSYFGDTHSVLSDIFYIIRSGKRAGDRFGLVEKKSNAGRYWIFSP
jgi:esterase/lipase superfamily enzyme